MERNVFWQKIIDNILTSHIQTPFNVNEVINIEEFAGSIWVTMKNGDCYYLDFQSCQPKEDMSLLEL